MTGGRSRSEVCGGAGPGVTSPLGLLHAGVGRPIDPTDPVRRILLFRRSLFSSAAAVNPDPDTNEAGRLLEDLRRDRH